MSWETLFLLGLVVAAAFLVFSLRQLERQASSFREELLQLRQESQATLTAQIGQLTQSFNQQLNDVRSTIQQGLTDAGRLTAQAQQDVGQRLAEASRLVSDIGRQLGGLQEAGRELSQSARTLESVLSAARMRGTLGEVALERLLADGLPKGSYDLQFRFPGGVVVDAVVHLGEKLLPIDSKFPLEAYRRLAEAATPEAQESARKEFARAVRAHVDDIARKYILPREGTLELALLFVASESVYYELLLTEDNKGNLAEYCRSQRVAPVSPNTLYAYLAMIMMGLKGMQIEENAKRLWGQLSGLQVDLESFSEIYARLGTHLKNASQSHADAAAKLEKLERSLGALAKGILPEEAEQEALENKRT